MSGGRDLVMVLDLLLIYRMPLGRSIVFLGLSFPICTKLGETTPGSMSMFVGSFGSKERSSTSGFGGCWVGRLTTALLEA